MLKCQTCSDSNLQLLPKLIALGSEHKNTSDFEKKKDWDAITDKIYRYTNEKYYENHIDSCC